MSIAEIEGSGMKKETALLNILCILAAVGFIAFAVLNAIFSGDFLTTDNLFSTVVCLVLALMFAVNPLLYLKSEGKLPIPFKSGAKEKSLASATVPRSLAGVPASKPPLLDAKGRAVPPDVRNMVRGFKGPQQKDG